MSTRSRNRSAATGQVSTAAAEVYEEFFVSSLFGQWASTTLDALGVTDGDRLLDVGTGTGVVARQALSRVGESGSVIAVDPNEGMLAVAARLAPALDVRVGRAENLPLRASEVDCAACQFALMFFDDRIRAVSEIARVVKPDGRIAVATWMAVEHSPGYAAMVELLGDEVGDWAAEALRVPFRVGTPDGLGDLLRTSFADVVVRRHEGLARFDSLDQWLFTDIRGWTLADHIDDDQFGRLRQRANFTLTRFVDTDGRVRFPAPALIATATRPA